MPQQSYRIEGMHCASCVQKIEKSLSGLSGKIKVSLSYPQLEIESDNLPDFSELKSKVEKAGPYRLGKSETTESEGKKSNWATYYPLILIVTIISVVSLRGIESLHGWMLQFMAGFFIVFSAFKLIDLRGFKDAYASYDIIAQQWNFYGYLYPFLELGLGLAFLFRFQLQGSLLFSIVLMSISSLGVIQALRHQRQIRCACLGTALNLPMSTITLVEDLLMVAMSITMLLQG
jgi:copper chaperone CopZ